MPASRTDHDGGALGRGLTLWKGDERSEKLEGDSILSQMLRLNSYSNVGCCLMAVSRIRLQHFRIEPVLVCHLPATRAGFCLSRILALGSLSFSHHVPGPNTGADLHLYNPSPLYWGEVLLR